MLLIMNDTMADKREATLGTSHWFLLENRQPQLHRHVDTEWVAAMYMMANLRRRRPTLRDS